MHQENYYPYAFIDSVGESAGILIDFWKLWAENSNVEIEFVHSKNPNYIKDIVSGKVDIIAGMKYNEEWVDSVFYTEFILRINTVIYLRNDMNPKTINDIDFPIATIDNAIINSNSDSVLKAISFQHLKMELLAEEIEDRSVKGFIYDSPALTDVNKAINIPKGYYAFKHIRTDYLRPIVHIGRNDLKKLILKGRSKISEEELQELSEKWGIIRNHYTAFQIISLSVILLLILISIFIYFIFKKKNRAQTLSLLTNGEDWKSIIKKGENDLIEFKSSLRWDYRQGKLNKTLEQVIAKTISAFMNTEGGLLFIGVDDNGNILGIENDYQTMSKQNSDGFMLTLTNVINQYLGKENHQSLSINIISINNKDVCIISITKSKSPVFLGKSEKEEFYIRASASSQPMNMSESYKYISTHWDE